MEMISIRGIVSRRRQFNQLLDDALKMSDTDEIAEAYAQAQAIAWEECPWIFLGNSAS